MYLIIKDYQIIMEVVYNEAPTSLAYSSNKRSTAMYPLLQCKIPIRNSTFYCQYSMEIKRKVASLYE